MKSLRKISKLSFKKVYFLIIALILAVFPLTYTNVFANDESLEAQLNETVDEQLENLDISSLNSFFDKFCDDKLGLFGETSLISKIQKIINGEFSNSASVLTSIANVLLEEVVSFLPLISSIIAIAVLASLLTELKGTNKSIGDIIHFVCFGVIITIILGTAVKMINLTSLTLGLLSNQMEVVFPILLTLITAMGGTVSVAVFQPAVALLTVLVSKVFTNILLPVFIFALVFTILSNISTTIKLDKFASFLTTLFKWIIGIVFTIFMGFLAVKGITAGSIDSVSFKTARYSLSTYIPIVGGYLSEGLNLILASTLLIKNAIGTAGLLLMLTTIVLPLIQLILFMFTLKFIGAILQPLSDSRISSFSTSLSKIFVMPIVMVLAVAFMYTIFVGLIMCLSVNL